MTEPLRPREQGRGSVLRPPNRFERMGREDDFEQLAEDDELLADDRGIDTQFIPDRSRSLVTQNDSPDIPFRYSVNPYRGCEHGCAYCYARNTHEYLGYNAGSDFESRIIVKYEAAELFREFLANPSWRPEVVVFSGVTDCYQPAERRFRLTRQCLEVAHECRLPIGIVTKNALVLRDLDLLREMAQRRTAQVNVSITTLDPELARRMEPRTSAPAARLRAVRALSEAGIPTRVMVAPIIPGLNDAEVPAILHAAKEAGATGAASLLLRLPLTVAPVFLDWLRRTQPLKADRVESLIRETRGGTLSDARFGSRMTGAGPIAEQIRGLFQLFCRKLALDSPLPPPDFSQFRPPLPRSGQMRLF
jgi:DNA repair photolyase